MSNTKKNNSRYYYFELKRPHNTTVDEDIFMCYFYTFLGAI